MSWWEHFITNNCFWKTLHTLVYHFLSPSARTLEVCRSSELPGSSPHYLVAISSLIINEAAYPWVSRFLTRKAAVTMIHCIHFCVAEVQKKMLEAGEGIPVQGGKEIHHGGQGSREESPFSLHNQRTEEPSKAGPCWQFPFDLSCPRNTMLNKELLVTFPLTIRTWQNHGP